MIQNMYTFIGDLNVKKYNIVILNNSMLSPDLLSIMQNKA